LAVTRDTSSNSAQRLQSKSSNIKLVQGNLDQVEDIFICAQRVASSPIWGVFSVQVRNMFLKFDARRRLKDFLGSCSGWIKP
jgi:hypothetical protein